MLSDEAAHILHKPRLGVISCS